MSIKQYTWHPSCQWAHNTSKHLLALMVQPTMVPYNSNTCFIYIPAQTIHRETHHITSHHINHRTHWHVIYSPWKLNIPSNTTYLFDGCVGIQTLDNYGSPGCILVQFLLYYIKCIRYSRDSASVHHGTQREHITMRKLLSITTTEQRSSNLHINQQGRYFFRSK